MVARMASEMRLAFSLMIVFILSSCVTQGPLMPTLSEPYVLLAYGRYNKGMNGSRFGLEFHSDSVYHLSNGGIRPTLKGKWAFTSDGEITFYPEQSLLSKEGVIMIVVEHQKKGRIFFSGNSATGFSMHGAIGRVVHTRKYEAIVVEDYRFLQVRPGYSFWPVKNGRWKIIPAPKPGSN
jgi:hypothetical protein